MLSSNQSAPDSMRNLLSNISLNEKQDMFAKQSLPKLQTSVTPGSPSSPHSPSAYTPRKYLKILVHVLKTLVKHHAKLSVDFLGSLKV